MPAHAFDSDLQSLPNLGRTSVQWLMATGIRNTCDLQRIGAVAAWHGIDQRGFRATRSLLYALHGALVGVPWRDLPAAVKDDLWLQASQAAQPRKG